MSAAGHRSASKVTRINAHSKARRIKLIDLKGVLGDAINLVLSACGQNLRKLLEVALLCPIFWVIFKVIMAENKFSTGKA